MPTFPSLVVLVSFNKSILYCKDLIFRVFCVESSELSYLFFGGVLVFQQLEIDYVIGETNKDLMPNSSGPAAIIRIFGVTKEGIFFLSILTDILAAKNA